MKTIGSQSLDQKLKRFFFLHWEKIIVTLAFLGIGGFCWFGYVKPYDKTNPTKLRQNVQAARNYIESADSWTEIASFRKADDQAAEKIASTPSVEFEPYLMTRFLGTKAATRGLRSDPEIKNPIDAHAEIVIGTVLIQRPIDGTGHRRDLWSELIEIRRVEKRAPGSEEDETEDFLLGGRGGTKRNPVRPQTGDKKVEVIVSDVMRSEFAGLSPAKLGLNPDEHTSLVVSAVAVTGLFPHELQAREYEKFRDSIKYNELRDQPYYVYLQVERRKRVDGQETEWEDVTKYVTEDLIKNVYAATAPEIIEKPYVDPYLTVKIPPFVWLDYKTYFAAAKTPVIVEKVIDDGPAVVVKSSEAIKLQDFENQPKESDASKTEVDEKKLAPYKLIRFVDMSVSPGEEAQYRFRVWLADPNDPEREVYDRVWNKDQIVATSGGQVGASGEDEAVAGTGGASRGTRGNRQTNSPSNNPVNVGDPYDLTYMDVEPKVRKRIADQEAQPDPPAPIKFLKKSRPSDWSEPTEWVRIPHANAEVVAGRVETGLQQSAAGVIYFDDEPQVNVVVKKWDPALNVQIPVPRKVHRGTVMNFRSAAHVVNPIDRQVYEVKRELIEEGTEENGVKFSTNSFVVDMIGGQKMPFSTAEKTYFEPSEILVMGEDGRLEVRNELGDRMEYRHGIYADDELLTDAAPEVKEKKKPEQDDGGLGGRGARGGRERNQ